MNQKTKTAGLRTLAAFKTTSATRIITPLRLRGKPREVRS